MIQFTRITLLLGMASSLLAQTLSFGEITSVTPATTPPSYVVNINLTTAGTASAGLAAGLQFDVNYDPAQLKVTAGVGANTSAFQINTTCLGSQFAGCTSVATFNPSTSAPMNNGAPGGQRAIIVGCCSTAQVGGTSQVTSSLITDGPVATLTVQPQAGATTTGQTLTLLNPAATSQGGNNVAAASIPLTIGQSVNNTGVTTVLDLYPIYLVGDVNTPGTAYPPASTHSPTFGTPGKLNLADLLLMLEVATNAPGFAAPQTCSDLFDAMDAFPADTATTRGGDGSIKLNDLILVLERATNAPGFTVWPYRNPRGLTCGARTTPTASLSRSMPEVRSSIVLGTPENGASGQDRVPVYLDARRELNRVAVGFSVGDEQSQLRFTAADTAPSLMQDSQPGFVAAAWLDGLTVRAGQRLLLGYISGPTGSAANIKVFGVTATGLTDNQDVGIDASVRR